MPINVPIGGNTYDIGITGERSWGDATTDLLVELSTQANKVATSSFSLITNFTFLDGSGLYGVNANYYFGNGSPASSGFLRMDHPDRDVTNVPANVNVYSGVAWRNVGNTADLILEPKTTSDTVLQYGGQDLVGISEAQTLTNKTIDVDNNTVSNIETDNLKSGVLITATDLTGAADTNFPSTLAVKTYIDDATAAGNEFVELTDTPANYTGSDNKVPTVDESGTQLEFNFVADANIDAAANINATKLSTGAVNNTQFDLLSTAGNDSAGELVKTDSTQSLSNKILVDPKIEDPGGANLRLDSASGLTIERTLTFNVLDGDKELRLGHSFAALGLGSVILQSQKANTLSTTLLLQDKSSYTVADDADLTSHTGLTNEHVDHSGVDIATEANSGLAGGGDITTSRTLSLDINNLSTLAGSPEAADKFALYDNGGTTTGSYSFSTIEATLDHANLTNGHNLTSDIDHDQLTNYVSNEHIDWTSTTSALLTTSTLSAAGITDSSTGATQVASGTGAQRPGSPAEGMFRYNEDSDSFEGYSASGWGAIGGGGGGGGWTSSYKSSAYTAATDEEIQADTSGGSWTLTLPSSPSNGDRVRVIDIEGTFASAPLTIGRNGETIQGDAADLEIDVGQAWVEFVYSGTESDWRMIAPSIGEAADLPQTAVVTSGANFTDVETTLTTNTVKDGFYWRSGDTVRVKAGVRFTGTNTQGDALPTLPSGLSPDISKLPDIASGSSDEVTVGSWHYRDSGSVQYSGTVVYQVVTGTFLLACSDGTFDFVTTSTNHPTTVASGDMLSWDFSVPVAEWAGDGTVPLASSHDVEYVSYDTTGEVTEGTAYNTPANIVRGTSGSNVPAIATKSITAGATSYVVSFAEDINATDRLEVQLSTGNGDWVASDCFYNSTYGFGWDRVNSACYGISIRYTNSNSVVVHFGRAGVSQVGAATHGAVSSVGWSSVTGLFWRVVKTKAKIPVGIPEATVTDRGLVTKSRWQRKHVTASVTSNGAISDLAFSDLTVGKTYRLTGQCEMRVNQGGADVSVNLTVAHDSNDLQLIQFVNRHTDSTTGDISSAPFSAMFTATATSLSFTAGSASADSYIVGSANGQYTYAILEEVNNTEETSDW